MSEHGRRKLDEIDFLAGDSEMAALIRAKDWSATPLGPIADWPQSLRTTVSLCLASNFPIDIIWGPKHNQIYNDGYWPICGAKHPQSMGLDFRECWASAWPVIGEAFESALAGQSAFLENQRLFIDRYGKLEETFFTFSFSPIRDETGGVGGLFHPVTETTMTMVGARRTHFVRDVTARLSEAKTVEGVLTLVTDVLATQPFDLPFALLYHLNQDDDGNVSYQLAAHTGLAAGTMLSPLTIPLDADTPWPVATLADADQPSIVNGLTSTLASIRCGPYEEPPDTAVALPIGLPGSAIPVAIIIAGVSPRLPFDDAYRGFYDLVAAAVTAALVRAARLEDERQRAEALTALDRAKIVFFSNISHEFRTPLTLMLGPLEETLAEADYLTPVHRERLDMTQRNALRLLKLVNSLLDFARIESARIAAQFESVDLAELTRDLASNFRSACERADLDLIIDCPPLVAPVWVDRDMWEKIVLNLISNAFKFTLEGRITVAVKAADRHVELLVSDTGVGIPADEQPNLFKRFYRIEGQQGRSFEGSGIGLALVEELVKLHNGTIRVSSVVDQGTIFVVSIPSGSGHLIGERTTTALEPTATRAAAFVEEALRWLPTDRDQVPTQDMDADKASLEPASIVLADDNADMRSYIARILRASGHHVEAVGDGEAVLASIQKGSRPDLVLTDVMMPGLDGLGLLRRLRADRAMEGLPIILLSARAGEEARVEGLAAGADDYLVKPFSARELRARVDNTIALARQRRAAFVHERDLHAALAKQETARLLRAIVDVAPGLIYAKDRQGRMLVANPAVMDLIGEPWSYVQGRTDGEFLDDKDQAAIIMANDRRIMDSGQVEELEELIGVAQDKVRVWLSTKTPLRDGDGRVVGLVGVSVEITERKRTEDRLRLMVHELNHRVKNTLAVVQATATQTLRTVDPVLQRGFQGRLGALAVAHDILTEELWSGADLANVIAGVLAPFGGADPNRFRVSGPPLRLLPRAAVALVMGLHELATNATKYGALSNETGVVKLVWQRMNGTFQLVWTETDGPLVSPPSHRGFGTRLIERSLARDLGGSTRLTFAREGVICAFEVAVDEVVAEIEVLPDVGNQEISQP